MSKKIFRVHPTINFARFGTSEEFYLSPDTSAGLQQEGTDVTGGLPIKAGTENETITNKDLRDAKGNLKKQAARFRLFAYDFDGESCYPDGGGTEVTIGTTLPDGRTITDLVWTVHLANKKAAAYNVVNNLGINAYGPDKVPQRRNPEVHGDVNAPSRLNQLMIDPGPRAISAAAHDHSKFDIPTTPTAADKTGDIKPYPQYPTRFPGQVNDQLFEPNGPIDSLGEILTDDKGRLLVLPSVGNAVGQYDEYGVPIQITGDLNNAGWYDSASDGPVSVVVKFDDGTHEEGFGGWVVCGDPSYAPQIRNVVSVWDDVYDTFVQELDLQPELYNNGAFNSGYEPSFSQDIRPIFIASTLQRWTANLPELALRAHHAVDKISKDDDPNRTIMAGLNFIRNPNKDETNIGAPLMPLSLGQAGTSFLTVTKTQYFLLEQWSKNKFLKGEVSYGPGELLDMASLSNCLGGRYVPGIEVSYPIKVAQIYIEDWKTSGAGPFRIKHFPLDYNQANQNAPFLNIGWIPNHGMTDGLQPGDLSKFMAIPWQTDYNSCSIHATAINTNGVNESNGAETTLYWSWPSQRPDAIYVAEEVYNNVLPQQSWSIRGPGTYADNPATAATFQDPLDSITEWDKIGIIIQGTNIHLDDGREFSPELYLEVGSQLTRLGESSATVPAWPFNANPSYKQLKSFPPSTDDDES